MGKYYIFGKKLEFFCGEKVKRAFIRGRAFTTNNTAALVVGVKG